MTRHGKIARLPLEVREELNQRLENGEAGVRLIEWLNELPEVKQVLAEDFKGVPISDNNLSQWKNGGFVDWQAQQRAQEVIERWQEESPTSEVQGPKSGNAVTSEKVAAVLKERLVIHYAVALDDAIAETDESARKRVERLGRSLGQVLRLRRHDLARERGRERSEIERERLSLERERLEWQRARLKNQNVPESEERARLSHQERAEMVKQMLEEA